MADAPPCGGVQVRRAVLLLVLGATLAPAVGAQPQEGWMLHVNRDAATGVLGYVPDRVDVYAGSVVLIGHLFGSEPHSITSVDGRFNATGNASAWPEVRAPEAPGEYRFYCWVHATPETPPGEGMAGVMVVHAREPAPENATPPSPPTHADPPPTATHAGAASEARESPGPALALVVGALVGLAALRRRA